MSNTTKKIDSTCIVRELNGEMCNKCNTPNCKYCAILDRMGRITSYSTGRSYYAHKNVTSMGLLLYTVSPANKCSVQYVAWTKLRCMDQIQAHFNFIQSKDPKPRTIMVGLMSKFTFYISFRQSPAPREQPY